MAFFIASGAGLPNFINIPGENFSGIQSANEFLTRVNLMGGADDRFDTPVHAGKNVVIIGGGNTAIRLRENSQTFGSRQRNDYLQTFPRKKCPPVPKKSSTPSRRNRICHLDDAHRIFCGRNGHVNRMRVQKMGLGEPDESGRRRPMPIEGSEYDIEVDSVIIAVGVSSNPIIQKSMPELEVTKWNTIKVDDNIMTSIPTFLPEATS